MRAGPRGILYRPSFGFVSASASPAHVDARIGHLAESEPGFPEICFGIRQSRGS